MNWNSKFLLILLTAVIALWPVSTLAINSPGSPTQIVSVDGYRHLVELNDLLIVGEYQITYGTAPTENIDQAFLFRLMYGTTEVGSYQPVSDTYYRGYRGGVFAFYFSASDYVALSTSIGVDAWNQTYTIRFEGNPSLSWSGSAPLYLRNLTSGSSEWHSSATITASQALLVAKLRVIASNIQSSWAVAMLTGTPSRFTTAGETYFTTAISNLQLMAPGIFPNLITSPTIVKRTHNKTYAQTLEDRWRGTPLDRMMYANFFGLSHMLWKSIMWVTLMMFVAFAVSTHMNEKRAVWFLTWPSLPVGAWLGMLPLTFTGLVAAMAFLGVGWLLFYNR